MMRRHDTYRLLLGRREELSSKDQVRLREHLAVCAECRERLVELDAIDGELRLLAQMRPPTGLREAVLARVESPPQVDASAVTPRPRSAGKWSLMVAAVTLAVVISAAGGIQVLRQHPPATVQSALAQKGYMVLSTTAPASVKRSVAERIALAFFPGKVRGVALARVSNNRTPAFGRQGRLCWVISISPGDAPLLARPGGAWLDSGSSAPTRSGYFVVFVDAHQGNFVLASSAEAA